MPDTEAYFEYEEAKDFQVDPNDEIIVQNQNSGHKFKSAVLPEETANFEEDACQPA